MAFADRITKIRRMALISKNGIIYWEGANIEGTCVLKEVRFNGGIHIMTISENEIEEFCLPDLKCCYQDIKGEKYWEPRKYNEVK
jgi:hypothetical protein